MIVPALGRLAALGQCLLGAFNAGQNLPAPDLIIGAGHRTHFTVLAARRAHGGRAVVLMQPSLPLGWFDLCLIPEHDRPRDRPNVERTYGVLNTVLPASHAAPDRGLFLIGGPSAHHAWAEARMVEQILTVLRGDRADSVDADDVAPHPRIDCGGVPCSRRTEPRRRALRTNASRLGG
jgi:hypothetical protein